MRCKPDKHRWLGPFRQVVNGRMVEYWRCSACLARTYKDPGGKK